MKAVRCSECGLLVKFDDDVGDLTMAEPLNHDPVVGEDGFAMPASDNPQCSGGDLLGYVTEVNEE